MCLLDWIGTHFSQQFGHGGGIWNQKGAILKFLFHRDLALLGLLFGFKALPTLAGFAVMVCIGCSGREYALPRFIMDAMVYPFSERGKPGSKLCLLTRMLVPMRSTRKSFVVLHRL